MPPPRHNKDLITILTKKILPWWEHNGLTRLVTSANTLKEFKKQTLPDSIHVSVKKRRGKKVAVRSPRLFNNTSLRVATWPEDGQESLRYPVLACVLNGQADFHIADYVVHCPQEHFILFNANVPQPNGDAPHFEGEDFSQRYCEVLWLMAPPAVTHRIHAWMCYSQGNKHWGEPLFSYALLERLEMVTFFNSFIQEVTERPSGYRKMAEVSFQAFLLLFIRELSEGRYSHSSQEKSSVHDSPQLQSNPMELAIRHINHHLNQNLTIQSVADVVYMSRSNFIHCFQQETGRSFNQYLTSRRLEEARRLLSEGAITINIVCRLIGLSPAQFRKLFQKYYGTSPAQFVATQKEKTI